MQRCGVIEEHAEELRGALRHSQRNGELKGSQWVNSWLIAIIRPAALGPSSPRRPACISWKQSPTSIAFIAKLYIRGRLSGDYMLFRQHTQLATVTSPDRVGDANRHDQFIPRHPQPRPHPNSIVSQIKLSGSCLSSSLFAASGVSCAEADEGRCVPTPARWQAGVAERVPALQMSRDQTQRWAYSGMAGFAGFATNGAFNSGLGLSLRTSVSIEDRPRRLRRTRLLQAPGWPARSGVIGWAPLA